MRPVPSQLRAALGGWACAAFLSGSLAAQVTFQLGDVVAAPGQSDAVMPLSILVEPGADPVVQWEGAVSFDPAVFRKVTIESTRSAGSYIFHGSSHYAEPGRVGAAVQYDGRYPGRYLSASNDDAVAFLRLCLFEDAPPGAYPIDFVSYAPFAQSFSKRGIGTPLKYAATASGGVPATRTGSVRVQGDPALAGECPPDPENYLVPSTRAQASFRVVGGVAAPGGPAEARLLASANGRIFSFAFSVDFDEEVLQATSIEKLLRNPDGTDWEFARFNFSNSNHTPGNTGIDEGYLVGAAIFAFGRPAFLPPDVEHELLAFHFQVKPEAALGPTALRFLDGARVPSGSVPVQNHLLVEDATPEPQTEVSPVLIGSFLQIVSDVILFVRGDSNGDEALDVSDALYTLSYLFLGGGPPRCFDAADANDDGALDVADPVFTLQFLFQGGASLAAPTGTAGPDPTADGMGCLHR